MGHITCTCRRFEAGQSGSRNPDHRARVLPYLCMEPRHADSQLPPVGQATCYVPRWRVPCKVCITVHEEIVTRLPCSKRRARTSRCGPWRGRNIGCEVYPKVASYIAGQSLKHLSFIAVGLTVSFSVASSLRAMESASRRRGVRVCHRGVVLITMAHRRPQVLAAKV